MIKNVFNWSVGSFFRTLGRIVAYIIVGALIGLILSNNDISISNLFLPKLSAATLTSYNTYERIWNQETGCGTSNRYSYTTYANSDPAGDLWNIGSFNTQYSGKAAQLGFNFQYNLTAGKYYDIDVIFNTSDLSSSLNTTNVYVESGTSCQDTSGSRVALIGFTLSNSGTNYSNKATIRIMANSATTYWGFYFYKGPTQFVTGVNNWRINSITINEVDPSNTNIIIDNATNNTTNIINNNNENTQQIINNQNELLGSKCENLLDKNSYTINNGFLAFDLNNLVNGKIYTISTNLPVYTYKFSSNNVTDASNVGPETWTSGITNWTFTYTGHRYLFINISTAYDGNSFVSNISQLSNYNFMLVEGSTSKTYCEFGSYSSKLDDTNSAINGVNDTLNNDNVSDATSSASNFFSNFTTDTHGLTAIITAPLSAIQSLTSASCSPLVLPLPFVNQNLTLPCMREIYVSTFGGFMTLYDTITLGIISYWVLVRIFTLVKDFKNPEHDEIEVMDL